MIFFTDRDLGEHILPSILRSNGIHVERHVDHFSHGTEDAVWIPKVAAHGWYILTHDQKIRYRPLEKAAVLQSGAGMFILIGRAPHRELAQNFVHTLPKVTRFIEKRQRPFIAKIRRPSPPTLVDQGEPGAVDLWVS